MFLRQIVNGAWRRRPWLALLACGLHARLRVTDVIASTSRVIKQPPTDYRREGTAIFKTGEKASLAIVGKVDVTDDKGMRPLTGRWLQA